MGSGSRWRPLRVVRPGPRVRLSVWLTIGGIVLSLVAVVLSALNAISTQQAIALALPAGLTTVGGMIGLMVPDAWNAWRRGFRCGCEAAWTSQSYRLPADVTTNALREIRLTRLASYPRPPHCSVCGRAFS